MEEGCVPTEKAALKMSKNYTLASLSIKRKTDSRIQKRIDLNIGPTFNVSELFDSRCHFSGNPLKNKIVYELNIDIEPSSLSAVHPYCDQSIRVLNS